MAFDFLRSPLVFIDSIVQQYSSTVGLKLGGEHVVLTGDPAISRQVLIDQADVFVKVRFSLLPLHDQKNKREQNCAHLMYLNPPSLACREHPQQVAQCDPKESQTKGAECVRNKDSSMMYDNKGPGQVTSLHA